MKISLALMVLAFGCLFFQGCASQPKVVRSYDENTTRVIESEPRIGQPVRGQ